MGSDIANGPCPRTQGIGAPVGLFVVWICGLGQPILGVFRMNNANVTQVPIGNHFARLTDQRIARVIMCQEKSRA